MQLIMSNFQHNHSCSLLSLEETRGLNSSNWPLPGVEDSSDMLYYFLTSDAG